MLPLRKIPSVAMHIAMVDSLTLKCYVKCRTSLQQMPGGFPVQNDKVMQCSTTALLAHTYEYSTRALCKTSQHVLGSYTKRNSFSTL
jgi:hypothetical protein